MFSLFKNGELIDKLKAIDLSNAIIEFYPDGTIISANENFLNLIGYSLSEIVGKHHGIFVENSIKSSTEYGQFWSKLASGQFQSGQFKRLTKQGNVVWIQGAYNPIIDKSGKTIKVIKTAFDITEGKTTNLHLKSQIEATSRAFATIEFTPDGIIKSANDNFLNLMGYTAGEVVGKHHRMFVGEEHQKTQEYTDFWNNLRLGKFQTGEFLRVTKAGKTVLIQGAYNPLLDDSGKVYAVSKFASDITSVMVDRMEGKAGVEEISVVLKKIADGDLTCGMTGSYHGIFCQIEDVVNNMINKIKNMVSTIKETAVSLGGVTDEMKQAMEDLSHRSEAQASSLEETAASMEQISSTIRQNSDNSQQGSAIALSSQAAAVSGEKIVDEALEAMQLIESSSMRISDIMGVIDEIAFQTNLLALNAAVEAARAGEAGKGFAVVAEEVRNLAQRSAVASKEIKGLILTSNKQVSSGVRLVQEAGKSLKGILESTNNVASIVKEIAAASAEQSLGLEQINTAVSHMDEMTQQNASLVQTNMSSSLTLQEKAQILLNIVSQFQIGNEDASVITKPKVAEKMSLPSPKISTPKPVTEGARKSSDKIESPSSVTVQTVAKLSKEEDWAEF